jgi:hypothetical protein
VLSAALAGVVSLAGCSSAKGSSSPTTSATTTTTVPSAASTTLTPPTTSTTVPGCTGSNYALSLLGSQGAAGTTEVTFGFRNTSSATCPLFGYPGFELLGPNGHAIATNAVRGGNKSFTDFAPVHVSVGPGATAYFNIGFSDVTTGTESSCPTATGVQAIPPNTTAQLVVSGQFTVCNGGTVDISPVFGQGSALTQTTAPPHA